MIATEQSLTRATVARYAVGSLGTGGFATLPGLVLVYYLTDSLGVAAIALASIAAAVGARPRGLAGRPLPFRP